MIKTGFKIFNIDRDMVFNYNDAANGNGYIFDNVKLATN
jgi:hypothetical protein